MKINFRNICIQFNAHCSSKGGRGFTRQTNIVDRIIAILRIAVYDVGLTCVPSYTVPMVST